MPGRPRPPLRDMLETATRSAPEPTTPPGALFPPVRPGMRSGRYLSAAMPVPRHGGRICARPDCARAATSSLTYHYGSSSVWVDEIGSDRDPSRYDLCELHAARVRVPHGWNLVDRRLR